MNHVAYVIPALDRIGGAEQQVISLATGIASCDWRVSVITLSGVGGAAAAFLRSHGIDFVSLHMRRGLADPNGWVDFRRWIQHEQPDVVHAHLPHAAQLARWSRMVTPVRALLETIHSPAVGGFVRQRSYFLSQFIPDLVTSVSQSAAQPWIRAGLLTQSRLAVVPNGIDLRLWKRDDSRRADMRKAYRLDGQFVWLAVGRLEGVKNHATLLRAMAQLPENTRLIIAGSGTLENDLKVLAKHVGINDRTQFLGHEPDVLNWMQAADAFVLSSRWEGMPLALMEASCCELPSVTTAIPAVREVLPASPPAFAADVNDPDALACAMMRLMSLSASERRIMGRKARESVAQHCDLKDVLTRWQAIYNELLQTRPYAKRVGQSPVSKSVLLAQ